MRWATVRIGSPVGWLMSGLVSISSASAPKSALPGSFTSARRRRRKRSARGRRFPKSWRAFRGIDVLSDRQERPRTSARSFQGNRGTGPDRLDFLNECQGRNQPCALFVFQRRFLAPAYGDVFKRGLQGFGCQRRRDEGIRLLARDLGFARGDEQDFGDIAARRQRNGSRGAESNALETGEAAARRGRSLRDGMQAHPDRAAARCRGKGA